MDSLIKEFSARFSQFKELSETFKFIMYPDVISFDKLNLSQFDWLEIELEMQLIDFQSSSIWIQKFIETRKKLELIEAERLTSNSGETEKGRKKERRKKIGKTRAGRFRKAEKEDLGVLDRDANEESWTRIRKTPCGLYRDKLWRKRLQKEATILARHRDNYMLNII
ncbi:uncharacterized protein TNCV_2728921 [Trichonephila clavipes]|nr:uncharacterized protein TNCV_2728921 [Trichonephila clavipes]